jgi:hypothetical protein
MTKLAWRVKLVTELPAGETTEVEVARIERDGQAGVSELGLRLAEAKRLISALQVEIIPAQVTIAGEHCCTCVACKRRLASKGRYTATFRSPFGDAPIKSASCWPTSSGTRERWSTTRPGAGMANRSRPLSPKVQSTRSSPNA